MSDQPNNCYACDQPATTMEHAPPSSFFPESNRKNLITVPSCKTHNNDNSKDVEYTRNVLTVMYGVNQLGEQHFADKTKRSLERNNASLLMKTFSDIKPAFVNGEEVGAFTVDTERVKKVLKACVQAIHFNETTQRSDDWDIMLPNLTFQVGEAQEAVDAQDALRHVLSQLNFAPRNVANPDIFDYGVAELDGGRVYGLRFYKGFTAFAGTSL